MDINGQQWTIMCTSRLFMYKIWCWVLANIGRKRLKGLLRRMLGSTYKHWRGATNVGEQLRILANIVEQGGNFGEQLQTLANIVTGALRWHYISGKQWHYSGTRHNWNWRQIGKRWETVEITDKGWVWSKI